MSTPLAVLRNRPGRGASGAARFEVTLHGRLLNVDRMLKEFGARGLSVRADAAGAVERQLVQRGPEGVGAALEGDWVLAVHDHGDGHRYAIRDAVGVLGAAWGIDAEGSLLVGSPGAVAEALGSPGLDPLAARWWLETGTLPAPLSGFVGVHRLPVGHGVRVDPTGRAEVFCWQEQLPVDHGLGAPGEHQHAAHRLYLALQPPTLRRWEPGTVLVEDDDLHVLVAGLLRHCGGRAVTGGRAEPAPTLPSLTWDGPNVDPRGAGLVALTRGAPALLTADGAAALLGAHPLLARHLRAGLLSKQDPVARHLGWRAGADEVPDLRELWSRPEGPRSWLPLLSERAGQVAHALDRLWWVREARLVTLGRVWAHTGVPVGAPFMTPQLEWVVSQIPLRLHNGLRQRAGVARALAREIGIDAAPTEQPAVPSAPAVPRVESVKDCLVGLVSTDRAARIWFDGTVQQRWRLATLVSWAEQWR